ncbi:MAG: hypothetical protein M1819_007154 [Sarea resinae]|nr:MAG: hypothetical protein M1819_007154 [Sarea resinae]
MALKPPLRIPIQHLRLKHFHLTSQLRAYSAPSPHAIPPSKVQYVPTSGTYPRGFLASGTHVGVKASNTSFPDLALIASETPCSAAAVFTKNKFQAAPVVVSREVLRKKGGDGIRAVVVNSGCANAVTGRQGLLDAEAMGGEVDKCLERAEEGASTTTPQGKELDGESSSSSSSSSTLVMSTGVIGQPLPIAKILSKIPTAHSTLGSSHAHWLAAARAICTTDTFPKLLSTTFTLPSAPGVTYSLSGMSKGAGMIHPNMATLLGIVCTDAPIASDALRPLLKYAADRSFNAISVDGDTSTNDTVALLANGAAGGPTITLPTTTTTSTTTSQEDYDALQTHLTTFLSTLAKLVVRDGEGATKFITIRVCASPSYAAAKKIASTIARSPLVKTAMYGRDANWGRILCATGYSLIDDASAATATATTTATGTETETGSGSGDVVIPEQTSVSFVERADGDGDGDGAITRELRLLVNGEPERVDEARAAEMLSREDVEIVVRLRRDEKDGAEEAVYWTCDFSHEYVTINGDYRT